MTRCSPSRSNILALCVAAALFAASTPGFADSSHQPAIIEAHADGAMLRVSGFDFAGGTPKITLGSTVLSIVSATATHIDALLPVDVVPGSYLLTLTLTKSRRDGGRNDDNSNYDEFWMTIGGTGLQGPIGPQGPTGKDGVNGVAGKDGAPGAAGRDGGIGPAGRDGAPGPSGKDGATGLPGLDGAPGAQGPTGPQGLPGNVLYQSLAGQPCTVAACTGTTAVSFDPRSTDLRVSCVAAPGTNTLRVQTAVGGKLDTSPDNYVRFESDVAGFGRTRYTTLGFAEDTVGGLCAGQLVAVKVTRRGFGPALVLHGGSCVSQSLPQPPNPDITDPPFTASVTCNLTMNGNQTLQIQ